MYKNFKIFTDVLSGELKKHLPSYVSHKKMMPAHITTDVKQPYDKNKVKESAVLILFFVSDDNISTVIIKRPEYDGVHSGQIAFPGGKREKYDRTIIDTAIREAHEEVGIKPDDVKIIGTLSQIYVPPSMYIIHPIVSYCDNKPEFIADINEVSDISIISLSDLLNDKSKSVIPIYKQGKYVFDAPAYIINGYEIWGATAMIISELIDIIYISKLNELVCKK